VDQGIQILNLGQNAHRLLAAQPVRGKRSLLNFPTFELGLGAGQALREVQRPL
jgi:hypothetical protein